MKQRNSSRTGSAKRRRDHAQEQDENIWEYHHLSSSSERSLQTRAPNTNENFIEVPRKNYQVYDMNSQINSRGSILVAMYSNANAKRTSPLSMRNTEENSVMEDAWTRPATDQNIDSAVSIVRRATLGDPSPRNIQSNNEQMHEKNTPAFSSPSFASGSSSILQVKYDTQQNQNGTKTPSC